MVTAPWGPRGGSCMRGDADGSGEGADGCESVKPDLGVRRVEERTWEGGRLEKMKSYSSLLSGDGECDRWRVDLSELDALLEGRGRSDSGAGVGEGDARKFGDPLEACAGQRVVTREVRTRFVEEVVGGGAVERSVRRVQRWLEVGGVPGGPPGAPCGDRHKGWVDQLQKTKKMLAGELPLRQARCVGGGQEGGDLAALRGWVFARYRNSAALATEFIEELLQCEEVLLMLRDMAGLVEAREFGPAGRSVDNFLALHHRLSERAEALRAKRGRLDEDAEAVRKAGEACCTGPREGEEDSGQKRRAVAGQKARAGGPAKKGAPRQAAPSGANRGGQAGARRGNRPTAKGGPGRASGEGTGGKAGGGGRAARPGGDAGRRATGKAREQKEEKRSGGAMGEPRGRGTGAPVRPPRLARPEHENNPCTGPHGAGGAKEPGVREEDPRPQDPPSTIDPPSDLLSVCDALLDVGEEWFLRVLREDFCDRGACGVVSREDCFALLAVIQKGQRWVDGLPEGRARRWDAEGMQRLMADTVIHWGSTICELPSAALAKGPKSPADGEDPVA